MSMQRAFGHARRLQIEWLILALLGCAGTATKEGGAGRSETAPTTSEVVDENPKFDVEPKLISIDPVVYPDDARERKSQGIVFVRVLVGENGRVVDTRIIQSVDPSLDHAAIAAAKTAVFKPATSNGKPVAVWMVIPLEFLIHE